MMRTRVQLSVYLFCSGVMISLGCGAAQVDDERLQILVDPHGGYARKALEKETINLSVIQTKAILIKDVAVAAETIAKNLENMIQKGDEACGQSDKPDIMLFHEFPLTGYFYGKRKQKQHVAIEIPGAETAALGELAKRCDAYVVFGSYAKDSAWAGHILSINTVIGRDGKIVKRVWKPKNIKRFYETFEISTTTVESVQDKFRERYGVDDELPVIRTEFGNIAVTTVQLDPMVFAALTMKGAEIILRTSTLFFRPDVIYTAMVNNVYTAMANIPNKSPYGGHSLIVNPNGKAIAEVNSNDQEGIATAKIPIKAFRSKRRLPQYSLEFTGSVFKQYINEIPPNHLDLPEDALPQDGKSMKVLIDKKSRWGHPSSTTD